MDLSSSSSGPEAYASDVPQPMRLIVRRNEWIFTSGSHICLYGLDRNEFIFLVLL